MRGLLSLALPFALACGDAPAGGGDGGSDGGDEAALRCGPGVDHPPFEGANHVPDGTPVAYQANPPASGDHAEVWQTPWGPYDMPVPRERWVHNLEHGGIVLLYNCPTGCQDVVDELTAIVNGRRPDQYNAKRFILAPDTQMPRKVAAVAWLWRWQGDAVDTAAINCFIDARYDRAPESIP